MRLYYGFLAAVVLCTCQHPPLPGINQVVYLDYEEAVAATARPPVCPDNNKLETIVPGKARVTFRKKPDDPIWRTSDIRYSEALGTMAGVRDHLLACPEIESLDLRVTTLGCSDGPDRWNFPFRLAGGDSYPNITSMKLEGYDFGQSDWSDASPWGYSYDQLKAWFTYHSGFEKWCSLARTLPIRRWYLTNLQLWLEAMDWSRLESLSLIGPVEGYFAQMATPHLRGLRSLDFRSSPEESRSAIEHIVLTLPSEATLSNLTWAGCWNSEILEQILDKHGRTLEELHLYSVEPWHGTDDVVFSNATQLAMIADKAPNIQKLSLSIDRNGTWPRDTLKALSQIKTLSSVNIWLELVTGCMKGEYSSPWSSNDLPCQNGSAFRSPKLNVGSATNAFKYLLKENNGGALRNVIFRIGDWERPWDGALFFPNWQYGKAGKIECSLFNHEGHRKGATEALCEDTVVWMDNHSWSIKEAEQYLHDDTTDFWDEKQGQDMS